MAAMAPSPPTHKNGNAAELTRLQVQSTSQQHPLHATTKAAATNKVPSAICACRPTFQSNAAHLHGSILPVPSGLPVLQLQQLQM